MKIGQASAHPAEDAEDERSLKLSIIVPGRTGVAGGHRGRGASTTTGSPPVETPAAAAGDGGARVDTRTTGPCLAKVTA